VRPVLSAEELLENLATAVLVLGEDRTIQFVNTAAETLLGLSRKQAVGKSPTELVPDLQSLTPLLERTLETGQSFGHSLSFSVPQRDFDIVQVVCRVSLLNDKGSQQIIIEFLDSTQWRQLDREKALMSQREASRRIIRQLAHEIRNPLGGLRGAAQLLERRLNEPDLKEYTRVIIGEADRLAVLTESLLGPTQKPDIRPLNIHEPLEHVLLLIENEAPAGVSVVRDYDPSLPDISLDRDQIIQAFLNIARNAIQSVGETGLVIIRTRALTNYVIGSQRHRLTIGIEFEDNGPGISAAIEDSIFYPLVTDREGGTGLGLPMAQDLVSRHGGVIEFESEPGRTRFMVSLPLEPEGQSN
jgi:two-component system nitrogen regulation sensor histidine kinase GlnL